MTLPCWRGLRAALERLAPPAPAALDEDGGRRLRLGAGPWRADPGAGRGSGVALDLLKGIDDARDTLLENTRRFADGLPANNALLWGARGMGKSSLVKAVHGAVNRDRKGKARLALVEIHREDIASLPALLRLLRDSTRPFLLYCDDLSFDHDDTAYKSLKAALEGGIEGRPANVLFYATSNRRHLMPREMMDNERSTAINPVRGGGGESLAVGPLRAVARLPQLRAGRLSDDDPRLCGALPAGGARRGTARPAPLPGRHSAADARGASPGSSCRIWQARSASGSD